MKEVQGMYEECVSTHDPNVVIQLLNQHPYELISFSHKGDIYEYST